MTHTRIFHCSKCGKPITVNFSLRALCPFCQTLNFYSLEEKTSNQTLQEWNDDANKRA